MTAFMSNTEIAPKTRAAGVNQSILDASRVIKYGDSGLPLLPAIWRLYLDDAALPADSTLRGTRIMARELDSKATRRYNFCDLTATRAYVTRWIKSAGGILDTLPIIPWSIRNSSQLTAINLTVKPQSLLNELLAFWETTSRSPTLGEFRKMQNWSEGSGLLCMCILESVGEARLRGEPGEIAFLSGFRSNQSLLTLPLRDKRFRSRQLDGFSISAHTYKSFMDELVKGRLGRDFCNYLYEAESKLSECILEPRLMSELHALCESTKILSEPDRKGFFLRRIGAENGKPSTLREVGDCHGLTRERVRQILDKAVEQMNGVAPMLTPALDKAMGLMLANAPCTHEEAEKAFRRHGIDAEGVHANAIIQTYEFLGRNSYLLYSKEWGDMFIPAGLGVQTKLVLGKLDLIINKYCGISPELASQCLSGVRQISAALSSGRVLSRLLSAHPRYTNIGAEDAPWYIITEPDKPQGLFRALQRMAHVADTLSIPDVREGFRRTYKLRAHLLSNLDVIPNDHIGEMHLFIPDNALVNLILQLDGAKKTESGRVAVSRYRSNSIDIPALEKMTLDLLNSIPDGIALRSEIMAYCLERGVTKDVISLSALGSNVLLRRVSWCVYVIVGREINEVALADAKRRVSRAQKADKNAGGNIK